MTYSVTCCAIVSCQIWTAFKNFRGQCMHRYIIYYAYRGVEGAAATLVCIGCIGDVFLHNIMHNVFNGGNVISSF